MNVILAQKILYLYSNMNKFLIYMTNMSSIEPNKIMNTIEFIYYDDTNGGQLGLKVEA